MSVDLPPAGRSHDGGGGARWDVQGEVVDDRAGLVVGEGHAFEPKVTVAARHHDGFGSRHDGGVGVDQIEHTVGRRHRPLVLVERLAQPGEGPQQPLGEVHHHAVGPDAEARALDGEEAAEDEGAGEAHQDGHADEWREGRAERDGSAIGFAVVVGFGGDAVHLALLGHEALDGGDAEQVVGELSVEEAGLVADLGVAGLELALEPDRPPQDERDGQQ